MDDSHTAYDLLKEGVQWVTSEQSLCRASSDPQQESWFTTSNAMERFEWRPVGSLTVDRRDPNKVRETVEHHVVVPHGVFCRKEKQRINGSEKRPGTSSTTLCHLFRMRDYSDQCSRINLLQAPSEIRALPQQMTSKQSTKFWSDAEAPSEKSSNNILWLTMMATAWKALKAQEERHFWLTSDDGQTGTLVRLEGRATERVRREPVLDLKGDQVVFRTDCQGRPVEGERDGREGGPVKVARIVHSVERQSMKGFNKRANIHAGVCA